MLDIHHHFLCLVSLSIQYHHRENARKGKEERKHRREGKIIVGKIFLRVKVFLFSFWFAFLLFCSYFSNSVYDLHKIISYLVFFSDNSFCLTRQLKYWIQGVSHSILYPWIYALWINIWVWLHCKQFSMTFSLNKL